MNQHGRLFSRLMIDPVSGCVLWTGYRGPTGYGYASAGGRRRLVHRLVYEIFAGPIPPGLTLDHLCRVRHCVNVAHLEPVTMAENNLRGDTITAAFATATQCVHGHPFDLVNTYWRPSGGRDCRACQRARVRDKKEHAAYMRAWNAKRREATRGATS